jgi:hypothetical protein
MLSRDRVGRYLLQSTASDRRGLTWWDLSEIGLVAFGFLCYFLVRGAVVDRTGEALANARDIVQLEFALGLFVEPRVQTWVLEEELARRVANFVYFWLDFPLIIVIGLLMFWRARHAYTLLRDSLLISGGLALVIYWTFPVAPPRFLSEFGFVDTLEVYSNLSYQAQSMQAFVNPFAAVPSLHVGWSALVIVGVFIATGNWFARGASFVGFGLQSFSVVGTGNHFILDGVAGLLVCAAGLALALALQRYGYPLLRRGVAAWARVTPPETAASRPSVTSTR